MTIKKNNKKFRIIEEKYVPEIKSELRKKPITVPNVIYNASGIRVQGMRIKSFIFSTDIALIRNSNANAVLAVYPFTPQLAIIQAILQASSIPVFAGVGGGTTSGQRTVSIALQAELLGAYGVVVNAPISNDVIAELYKVLDIPIVATVVSENDDIIGKINAGARILNVSAAKKTPELIATIREVVGPEFPIIGTGGSKDEYITDTIDAGANAITYTPPSNLELFKEIMTQYRQDSHINGDFTQDHSLNIEKVHEDLIFPSDSIEIISEDKE